MMNKNDGSLAALSQPGAMALAGGLAAASQAEGQAVQAPDPMKYPQHGKTPPIPGPPGQALKYSKTNVWAQLTTGGKSYSPALQDMFLDPMFLGTTVWPIDQPASFAALVPSDSSARPSAPPPPPAPPGRYALGGGTEKLEPDDYPWTPSDGRPHPGYDVLVLNDQLNWPESNRAAAKKAVELGRGFVVLHYALGDNQDWPWWYQEVTGGLFSLSDQNGMKKSTVTTAAKLEVRPAGKHPILRYIDPMTLTNEEVFKGMWQSPKITPLLTTSHAGSDSTVAWVGVSSTARVVCIQMGTSRETFRNHSYRMLIRNSLLWTAGRLI
jgi:Trehalose utilisation